MDENFEEEMKDILRSSAEPDESIDQLLAEVEWNDRANLWLQSLLDAVQEVLDAGKYFGPEIDIVNNLIEIGEESGYIEWNCGCEPGQCENPDECERDVEEEG